MIKTLDIAALRNDFPILRSQVNGKPLVYFDNAATTHKPQVVIDAISNYYTNLNANVHRGVHSLSQKATDAFEATREAVRAHINAAHTHEIIFTKGTTESINLVASSFTGFVKAGDNIVISAIEHHSNIVPWQLLAARTGVSLRVIPVNDAGELELDALHELLDERTKLVAINHISNALGTINPIKEICAKAHAAGAAVLIDGAQALPHMKVDVQALDADFYAFSGHKVFGPTGVGVLYGKEGWLQKLPPYQGGGEMIKEVSLQKSTWADLPHKFEAGTPNIEGVIALKPALDYINAIGLDAIAAYENELLAYGTEKLSAIDGLRIIGTAAQKASVLSFVIDGTHPYDIGMILDKLGIAVRTGHHCTQPIMERFGLPGTVRASFAFYNTLQEIDILVAGVNRAVKMLT
jgi:cysteine desulfurase/selenocysteine lyase